jgi:ATP-dependent helicase/nuclease subunit B
VTGLMAAVAAGHTVLAPNTELAAALFDAVERAHQSQGREVWPTPRVRDFGSWLLELHSKRQLEEAAAPRVLGDIDERELWRDVVESSDVGREILEPAGAARAARRARRAIREYGIPFRAVELDSASAEESRVFLEWNRRFEERCCALGCISAAELLGLTKAPAETIVWLESPVWRPMARQWLQRHGTMLAPERALTHTACRLSTASPAAELASIADWALTHLRASPQFRAWICIPDLNLRRAEVVDAFDAELAPQRFSLTSTADAAAYAVAGGTPLAEFAPVRAALDMLAASVDLVSFERFSALLRAPELQGSAGEAAAAAILDLQLRRRGPAEADLAGWLALGERLAAAHGIGPNAALLRLRAALHSLEALRGNHPISRWVPEWIAALEAAPWALRARWLSTEYQAAERFRELLGMLATADAIYGSLSRRAAQRLLRRASLETPFQVQTGVPPIWVSGQLIDPWLSYDGLWVSGCSDARWPPAADPIPLLPVKLQRDYGVIAAAPESQLQFALDLQLRWTERAVQCVFSYPDPGDGRCAAPSPLLPDTAAAPSAALPRPHWHALLQTAPALTRIGDELAPAFATGERTRGVSTLRAQSRCAFRGFAETRLRADRLERPVPGFNDHERGDLVHHALEHIWRTLRSSAGLSDLSAEAQAALLDDAAVRALAIVCRARDPGTRWRLRERERMRNVLHKWLSVERLRPPFEVEMLEQGKQVVRHAGLDFSFRIDRVDQLTDGTRVLIDYKTGRAPVDWRGDRPDNPQLPLYALSRPEALVAVAYGRVNASECRFVAEAERGAIFRPGGPKTTLEGQASLAALIHVWSQRIENLAADFAAGRAAVAPTLRACKSCTLQGLCRIPGALEDAVAPND